MGDKRIEIDGNSIPIKRFKLSSMVANPAICMIAKRGSGKSWVVRSILKYFEDIPAGAIIAPTDRMNIFYGNFIPQTYIHYTYKSEIIENILHRQEMIIAKAREKILKKRKLDPRAFIVMDDCLSTKGTWLKDEPIMKMFYDGRHYKIMYILTMQFPLGIGPELRCNFDYIFLLAEDFFSNQKRLYDHYAGMFPNFESFRQVFVELTSDFGCLVINNRGARRNLFDKVFWYKADNKDIKSFGCKQYNDFHNNNYDPEWNLKKKHFDLNKHVVDKKKTKLKINKVESD